MGWVQSFAGADAKGGNRIILLRDVGDDGVAKTRTVFLDNLNSPFGVALVGGDLYVANTDAIVRYPYTEGETNITAPGTKITDLPGGPIDHHWTKSLLASPDGSKLYVGVGSNSNIAENGMQVEVERAAIWEVDRRSGAHRIFASGLRNPTGLQWEPQTGALWAVANERDELGPDLVPDYLTSVRDGGFYGWPYKLLRATFGPAGRTAAAGFGRQRNCSGLCAELPRRSTGGRFLHRRKPSCGLQRRRLRRRARELGSKSPQRLQSRVRAIQRGQA